MLHLWRAFCSIWSYPLYFCSGASISPNICDRGMQNSHSFQAFFPKIFHTDGVLVLSLALLLILRHAPSSMVHSRSVLGQQGSQSCYQPLLPGPCKLFPIQRNSVPACVSCSLPVCLYLISCRRRSVCHLAKAHSGSNSTESAFLQTSDQYGKS